VGVGLTPALDRLAAQGLRFTNARSVVPLTLPAHTTIFTGQLPPVHGARLNGQPLADSASTMAQRLKQVGYQTAAVVGAFVLDRRFGLAAGFDRYDDEIDREPAAVDRLQADRPASVVIDHAIAGLGSMSSDRPWLLWVHLYDPHAPYMPPADARARAAGDGYNGEVAFVDQQVGRLLAAVAARPDAERVVTFVMGDHGEGLGDHGEATHGMLVSEAALRVPLIISGQVPVDVRTEPASLHDILPTVLQVAGVPTTGLQGRVLIGAPRPDVESYAETRYPTLAGWSPIQSLVQDRWKLVVAERARLYDLVIDPTEVSDVAASRTSVVRAMSARLEVLTSTAAAAPASSTMSPEVAQRLRALGYVSPTTVPASTGAGRYSGDVMADWTIYEDALVMVERGQPEGALAALARVSRSNPDSPLFASTYARALAAAGRTSDALIRFRAAVARWSGDAELYHDLAVVAREQGLGDEAMRAEAAALAINPQLPSAHHGRGLAFSARDRHADAALAFEEAVRLDSTNAVYLTDLGNARRALGELDVAALAYTAALARAPRHADAANGLGVILVQQGRAAEAVQWLERASADATLLEARLNLGIALQESGQLARAREQYAAVVADPRQGAKAKGAARALLAQLAKPRVDRR
jgi:choline-sulfatase